MNKIDEAFDGWSVAVDDTIKCIKHSCDNLTKDVSRILTNTVLLPHANPDSVADLRKRHDKLIKLIVLLTQLDE